MLRDIPPGTYCFVYAVIFGQEVNGRVVIEDLIDASAGKSE